VRISISHGNLSNRDASRFLKSVAGSLQIPDSQTPIEYCCVKVKTEVSPDRIATRHGTAWVGGRKRRLDCLKPNPDEPVEAKRKSRFIEKPKRVGER